MRIKPGVRELTVTQADGAVMDVREEGERMWTALQRVQYDEITNRRRSRDHIIKTLIEESNSVPPRPASGQIRWADLCSYIHDRYLHCFINTMLLPLPGRDVKDNQKAFDEHTMLMERVRVLFNLFRGQPWGEHGLSMLHDISNIMLSLAAGLWCSSNEDLEPTASSSTLAHQAFDLSTVASIFHIVYMLNKTDALNKGISLKVHGDQVEISRAIRCDLFRAVNELVVNAIKYADLEKEDRSVSLKSIPSKTRLEITVEDNGVGMKDTEAALVKGRRLHPDLAYGDGTGLYNVSRLAEANLWEFDVESVPSFGSSFTLVIPINMIGLRMIAGGW